MKWLIAIVAALVALFAGYQWAYPSFSYRFRLAVEIETPLGIKSGSSVLEVRTIQYPGWITLGANTSRTSVRGEAVLVELGNGANVIALLVFGQNSEVNILDLPVRMFLGKTSQNQGYQPTWTRDLSAISGRREVSRDLIPTLIAIFDAIDPRSARIVEPEDFEATFGRGVRLLAIAIEIVPSGWWPVNELGISGVAVTQELEKKLPWTRNFEQSRLVWQELKKRAAIAKVLVGGAPLELFRR